MAELTERASKAIRAAQRKARESGARAVGVEHLLAGLLEQHDSIAVTAIGAIGLDVSRLEREVGRLVSASEGEPLPLSERLQSVVELASKESKRLGEHSVGTEHLLIAILREGDSLAARALQKLGVSADALRTALTRLDQNALQAAWVSSGRATRTDSVLAVIDMQDSFLAPIVEKDKIVARCAFLVEIANLLEVPIVVTEQYRDRMGETTETIRRLLPLSVVRRDKLCFSSFRASGFEEELISFGRKDVVVVGIESHICVTQTALDLHFAGYRVYVCEDATGARPPDAHGIAMRRLRHAGITVTHSESVAYEWLGTAGTETFRRALEIVKRYSR
jgi:nicotinamidase-related amidase